ncbi:Lipase 4 [Cytospora mali]|uniref:Carboxylic ester hydrolase n=1 Tax=Cytospora mali TaxID=578113 RepID=A0A194V3Z6_CYTMA|nr:Lipase 4 [Valsa mali var. pyri (nom. inval.)]
MKGIISLVYSLALLQSSVFTTATPTVVDRTTHVTYKGINRNSIEVFLNIPYGQDTSGEHRFKPPRPYVPRRGSTIDAQSCGPACPQQIGTGLAPPITLSDVTNVSEDCLHLNLARPSGTVAGDKLPVLIFIHGGSFWSGQNCEITTTSDGMILESVHNGLPIIHVAINYRLGFFGFARSAALKSEGSENAGLRDQRLAIEWVRDNIEHFGGDPDKITISGQSSGGLSVGMQILAYGASKPVPFHQSICQSQALEPGIMGNFTNNAMQRVVDYVACNETSIDSKETVACLRALDTDTALNASLATYSEEYSDNIGDIWLPVVDGDFIPAAPSELIRQGKFANVTTMIGWADNDLTVFADPTVTTPNDTYNFVQTYIPTMTSENVHKLLSLYPSTDFVANETANLSREFYRSSRIFRDILMTCPPIWYSEHLNAAGAEVYIYDWNQTILEPIVASLGWPGLGPMHTSEFAYIFGNLSHYDTNGYPFNPTDSDYALVDRGSRSWTTFVHTGVPYMKHHDTFQGFKPAYEERNQTQIYVVGGPHEGLSPIDGPDASPALAAQRIRARCEFLTSPELIEQLRF